MGVLLNGRSMFTRIQYKNKIFYGMDSKCLVDYGFKQRTDFDKKLLKKLYKNKLKKKDD